MGKADRLAREQMIERYTHIRRQIEESDAPENCTLGKAMQTLGILICDTQIFTLRQTGTTPADILLGAAQRSPLAAAIIFASWVIARATGVL